MPYIHQETLIHSTVQCIQANINAFVSGNGIVVTNHPEDVTCPDCLSLSNESEGGSRG